MKILVQGLGLLLSLSVVGVVLPQSPGNPVLVNEGICDDLTYATPGLYGLCVAYCEARDCVEDEGTPPSIRCNAVANSRILANYNRKKTESDPPMPCLVQEEPCPCWTAEEVAAMFPETSVDRCRNDLNLMDTSTVTCTGLNVAPTACTNLQQLGNGAGVVANGLIQDGPVCQYIIRPEPGKIISRVEVLSAGQATACSEQLQARGSEGGWSCFP